MLATGVGPTLHMLSRHAPVPAPSNAPASAEPPRAWTDGGVPCGEACGAHAFRRWALPGWFRAQASGGGKSIESASGLVPASDEEVPESADGVGDGEERDEAEEG